MSDTPLSPRPRSQRLQTGALIVGAAGLTLCAIDILLDPPHGRIQFFRSYLFAFMVIVGIPLGSLAILMVHHLTGGAWGAAIRGVLESATRTLPLVALLFGPLVFGLSDIYPWVRWDAEEVSHSTILAQKQQYLNGSAFTVRALVYFLIWLAMASVLNRRTAASEQRKQQLSGPGLVLLSLTATFAAIDWMMSLEPFWSSTIFGMLVGAGQVLAAFAFGIIILVLSPVEVEAESTPHGSLQDLGSLLLTFVMVWAYLSFSQYLLIWSGNLPEEIPWYVKRLQGGWEFIGLLLILLQFILPFFLLLSRNVKRHGLTLAAVAGVVLAMRILDLYWMIVPAFHPYQGVRLHWMDAATLAGVGGFWLALFLHQLARQPHAEEAPHE